MGKQKDFRRIHHPSNKKKDKQVDKTSKPLKTTNSQEIYRRNMEVVVQQELETASSAKKFSRAMRKELDRYPLLAKAAFLGCERVVDDLVEAGENLNIQVSDGSTPLILATENGHHGIVQKLLKKGADPKLVRQDGRNALMIAVTKNDIQCFNLIWCYCDKNNFWELNHSDMQGYTILTIAVELGHSFFTKFFLDLNGLELDKQTSEGKTAMMFAVTGGQFNVVQQLLRNGSDAFIEDKNGVTAICLAISQNQHEIKNLLYETLDNNTRDVYVKKRIELLTRPRPGDVVVVITFYKDILFRVILEIRRCFQDGVVLLVKYSVFVHLYKCLDTYKEHLDFLRIGFHLTACLMYDKAEHSHYIAEELAEQYVSSKFADFTLKIMQHNRLKGMTELRGAAFLCIQAGTQCRLGKTWLKTNYLQLEPFVKEFKTILSILTFWADGESTKAKIMYECFLEIFNLVEKEVKISYSASSEARKTAIEPNTPPVRLEAHAPVSASKLSDKSENKGEWKVLSKTGKKKGSKSDSNTAVTPKKVYKMKNKKSKSKLKSKLYNKPNAKKVAVKPNLKFNPGLVKSFPTMPSERELSQICYADALKRNLTNKSVSSQHQSGSAGDYADVLKNSFKNANIKNANIKNVNIIEHHGDAQKYAYQESCDFSSNIQSCPQLKANDWSGLELDYDIERKKKKASRKELNANLGTADSHNLKIIEIQNENNFNCYGKSLCTPECSTNIKTFGTNFFQTNEKKNQASSQSAQSEITALSVRSSDTATEHSDGKMRISFEKQNERNSCDYGKSSHTSECPINLKIFSTNLFQTNENEDQTLGQTAQWKIAGLSVRNLDTGTEHSDEKQSNFIKEQYERNFCDYEKSSHTSEYPKNLKTLSTNLFQPNENKDQTSSQTTRWEIARLKARRPDSAIEHPAGKLSKTWRDILPTLGSKTNFDVDDTPGSKNSNRNYSQNAVKCNCEVTVTQENKITAVNDLLYSDSFKHTLENDWKNKGDFEILSISDCTRETAQIARTNQKDNTGVKSSNNKCKESTLNNECDYATEKYNKMISEIIDEGPMHYPVKSNEIHFRIRKRLSLELQGNREMWKEEVCKASKDDFDIKYNNGNIIGDLKRKRPEACYRDLLFTFCKEEIREVKEKTSAHLCPSYQYCDSLSRNFMVENIMNSLSYKKFNAALNRTVAINKIMQTSDENKIYLNTNLNSHGLISSKTVHPELLRNEFTEYNDVGSIKHEVIPNLNFETCTDKIVTISNNIVSHKLTEDRDILDESENKFNFTISGKFSNFALHVKKSNKSAKRSGLSHSLLKVKPANLPEITLNIQKFLFFHKRLILYHIDRPHLLTVLYMNTQCRVLASNLVKDFAVGSKGLKKLDFWNYQSSKKNMEKNVVVFPDECKLLKKFKSDINKILSYFPVHSVSKTTRKKPKRIRNIGIGSSKMLNKIRPKKVEKSVPKGTKSTDTVFTLCNDTYGYKPEFINCEQRSLWYKKLQRIESCIPLEDLPRMEIFGQSILEFGTTEDNLRLVDLPGMKMFGETNLDFGRSKCIPSVTNFSGVKSFKKPNTEFERDKCKLHEIVSGTGKIVFSSKEEHVLRQGDFGTHIGLMSDGNPVVVKMFKRTGDETVKLLSRKHHLNHKNIVTFHCLCSSPKDQKLYAVSELIEYSLPEYIKSKMFHFDKCLLVRDLVDAIKCLQNNEIVHGFLKPSNIMITIEGRLKVSDFYQLGVVPVVCGIVRNQNKKNPIPIGPTVLSEFCWRPYELIIAEKGAQILLTKASDIQMTGMLIYYILSDGKHPFGSTNLRCQENIRDGTPEFGPRPSEFESRDLVRDMIRRMPSQRLTLQKVAKHPYFWNIVRRIQFLVDVARKIEFFTSKPTKIAEAMQDSCIEARDWTCNVHPEVLKCVSKWMCKNYVDNYSDLLHFILSIHENFDLLSSNVKSYMGDPAFFISRLFPTFFMSVYCIVRDNIVAQQQMSLQAYF